MGAAGMGMEKSELFLQDMERELHDLCQPLTALQCGLELGQMCGDEGSLTTAVESGLREASRLFRGIQDMRERLLRELARVGDGA